MGIKASTMAETVVTVQVGWGEEVADVVVRPGLITRQMIRDFEEEATTDSLVEQTIRIVESWDVLNDEGEPLPVTREVVEILPFGWLQAVIKAAVEAVGEQGKD